MFVRPLGYYGVYAKKLFVRVPRLKKMFTGGYGRGDAIPSALPPGGSDQAHPATQYPPPELSASTAELNSTITITTATLRGLFPEGFFPGRWGTKKKTEN